MKLKGAKKKAFLRRMAKGRRKINKVRKHTKNIMARGRSVGRSFSRARRRFASRGKGKGMLGWLRPVAAGIGTAAIAEQVTMRVAPQFTPVAKLAGAYFGGGFKGLIGEVGYEAITGQMGLLGGLGGLLGGGSQTMTSEML